METGKRFQFASSANLAYVVSFKTEENRHFLGFNIHVYETAFTGVGYLNQTGTFLDLIYKRIDCGLTDVGYLNQTDTFLDLIYKCIDCGLTDVGYLNQTDTFLDLIYKCIDCVD